MAVRTGKKRLLAIEPYYGGSHRVFLDGMARKADFSVDIVSLPAHSWKWRMRFAAPYFAAILSPDDSYDCVLCSSMVDVAALRGMGPRWLRSARLVSYFHENQFAYPVRKTDQRDLHFAVTNLTSALASDQVIFNSTFNRNSFFSGVENILGKITDMRKGIDLASLKRKTVVLPPGMNFEPLDSDSPPSLPVSSEVPLLIWNHRWEHDKNPELFFNTLFQLQKMGIAFKAAILGQSFRDVPEIFERGRQELGENIVQYGHAPRDVYLAWLRAGSVVISTALHEFFGMAVVEAVRAGCRPLLPDRLSYPELFSSNFLYQDGKLVEALLLALENGRLEHAQAAALTEPFSWSTLLPEYERIFFG